MYTYMWSHGRQVMVNVKNPFFIPGAVVVFTQGTDNAPYSYISWGK